MFDRSIMTLGELRQKTVYRKATRSLPLLSHIYQGRRARSGRRFSCIECAGSGPSANHSQTHTRAGGHSELHTTVRLTAVEIETQSTARSMLTVPSDAREIAPLLSNIAYPLGRHRHGASAGALNMSVKHGATAGMERFARYSLEFPIVTKALRSSSVVAAPMPWVRGESKAAKPTRRSNLALCCLRQLRMNDSVEPDATCIGSSISAAGLRLQLSLLL